MEADRWQQIKKLFQEASEMPLEEREDYLSVMCSSDLDLLHEVEALLKADETDHHFLTKPVAEIAGAIIVQRQNEALIGTQLGPYHILELLGAGGMGAVYLARQDRLERPVAVKVLLPNYAQNSKALAQFKIEAKAVAALSHPNIMVIHDFGVEDDLYYSVTEFLEGQTLRERLTERGALPWREAVDIATHIANGLSAAHNKNILHRDLKPENIFLLKDGGVKILDFGLARIKSNFVSTLTATTAETPFSTPEISPEKSSLMGTLGYVSPEQIKGEEIGIPSDLFGFGCVLFEMLTGERAFGYEKIETNFHAILNEDPLEKKPPPTETPAKLVHLLRCCLEKNPRQRMQSAVDISLELRDTVHHWETWKQRKKALPVIAAGLLIFSAVLYGAIRLRPSTPTKTYSSLAVLPFTTISDKPDSDYLGEGFTDGLINKIAQISKLRVLSQEAIFKYRKTSKTPQAIGKELNVKAVISGTITKKEDGFAVQFLLTDTQTNEKIWMDDLQHQSLRDFQILQKNLALTAASKLGIEVNQEETQRLAKIYTDNAEALDKYLRGRYFFNLRDESAYSKSLKNFLQAVELDDNYALAHSGLADVYIVGDELINPSEAKLKTQNEAFKAIYLDSSLSEAHNSLAATQFLYDWNWSAAEREFREAIRLNPNYLTAHRWYAFYLSASGNHKKALTEIHHAQSLDPQSASLRKDVGLLYYYAGNYDQAIKECDEAIKIDASLPQSYSVRGRSYAQKKQFNEAYSDINKALSLSSHNEVFQTYLAATYAIAGDFKAAQKITKKLTHKAKKSFPYEIAGIYAQLGKKNESFNWLEVALREQSMTLLALKVDPVLAELKEEVRFKKIIEKIGL